MDAGREIFFENPTGSAIMTAAAIRSLGTYAILFYKPLYFANVYPQYIDESSVGNGLAYAFLGMSSALLGGQLSDRLESKSRYSKSAIVCAATLLACPPIAAGILQQDNFWFSLVMMGVHHLFAEAWYSPSLTMLQNTTSVKNQSFAVSVYGSIQTLCGLIATLLLGQVQNMMAVDTDDVSFFGTTLAAALIIPYLASLPFFFKAGLEYKKAMDDDD